MFQSEDHPQGASRIVPCQSHILKTFTSDFSKEQYGSLRMILGSKHVGEILSVLA